MLAKSLCSANLFFAERLDGKRAKALSQILGQYNIQHKDIPGSHLRFDLTGLSFDDVRGNLLESLLVYLDPSRRSLLNYLGHDGSLKTVAIKGGQVFCS